MRICNQDFHSQVNFYSNSRQVFRVRQQKISTTCATSRIPVDRRIYGAKRSQPLVVGGLMTEYTLKVTSVWMPRLPTMTQDLGIPRNGPLLWFVFLVSVSVSIPVSVSISVSVILIVLILLQSLSVSYTPYISFFSLLSIVIPNYRLGFPSITQTKEFFCFGTTKWSIAILHLSN